MDDRLQTFLWVLGSGGFFAALGAAFGAVSGALCWTSGRTAGTAIGLRFADAFARVSDREMTRGHRGALVGAADGFFFLGLLGALVGAFAVYRVHPPSQLMMPLAWGGLALGGGAIAFGLLAMAIVRNGIWAVACLGVAGLVGALAGWRLGRDNGLMIGAIAGVVLGTLASFGVRRA
jgi:hypothetical protein